MKKGREMDHGWLVNPKKRRRRTKRMPAALRRYWASHRRRGRRIVRTRGHHRIRHKVHHRRHRRRHPSYGAAWALPSHYRGNPSLIKEVMGTMNPHRRRRSRYHHNPRHRRHGGGGHGMSSVGVMSMVRDPLGTATKGLVGSVGVFLPIVTANWLLPFPGTDIMSRLLRFATRAAAGGLLIQFGGRFMGRNAEAFKIGAFIGVAGSTVLDFLGTAILVGKGDVTQTSPMQLIAGFTTPAPAAGTAGLGAAYTRRLGVGAAYSRALGLRGLHGGQSIGTGFKHGLFGGV
jgi:hypothetical protein